MIAKLTGLICLEVGMFVAASAASATGRDPITYSEAVFHDHIAVGQVIETSFATEIVPDRGKSFGLNGGLYNLQSPEPINVTLWLTWFDPRLPGGQQSTAPESYEIPPMDQVSVSTYVTVPFTPERVGVHIQNDGPGAPLLVRAFLNHVTTREPIPEPSAIALSVAGVVAMVVRRRRASPRNRDPLAPLLATVE